MLIEIQQLSVALAVLVPGFVFTGIQRSFRPKKFESDYHWFVYSLIWSIFLNLTVGSVAAFLILDIGSAQMNQVGAKLGSVELRFAIIYIAVLYAVSSLSAIAVSHWPNLSFRALLNRFGWTPFAPEKSAWDRFLAKQVPPEKAIWLKISFQSGGTLFGRLRHASAIVSRDKPIEAYLSPVFERLKTGRWAKPCVSGGIDADGTYLRLTEDEIIELYYKDTNWTFVSW